MKCITTWRTYAFNQLVDAELVAESQDRSIQYPLITGLIMTVKNGRYQIINGKGEIVRRGFTDGTPESIFDIYDSMTFKVGDLQLELPYYSGSFEDYEKEFGFGRVERVVNTKWKAYSEPTSDDSEETIIGLLRYDGQRTYETHSIYIPERMTDSEKSEYIASYVYERLKANEYATIQGVNLKAIRTDEISLYKMSYLHRHEQARLLYISAMEHKASKSEFIPEGLHYRSEQLFEEEGEGSGDDSKETQSRVTEFTRLSNT